MSLVTACPSCGVFFKVAPDQLLISEGWVRCGKCQTVFDAGLNLQPSNSVLEKRLQEGPKLAPEMEKKEIRADIKLTAAAEDIFDQRYRAGPDYSDPIFDFAPDGEQNATSNAFQFNKKMPTPAPNVSSTWRQGLFRWLLYLLLPLLLMALLLQVVLFARNQIVAVEPYAKPWLAALCLPFGCRLEARKQIESIVIDSSAFIKIRPDIYQLNLVLKNTAPSDLYLPSVELTLISSLDQPLLRRVFRVNELNSPSEILRASSELPLLLSFAIKADELSEAVSGYRLLIF